MEALKSSSIREIFFHNQRSSKQAPLRSNKTTKLVPMNQLPRRIIYQRPPRPTSTISPEFHSMSGRTFPSLSREIIPKMFPQLPASKSQPYTIIERYSENPESLSQLVKYLDFLQIVYQPEKKSQNEHEFKTRHINRIKLNQDPNPIVVRRKPAQPVRYQQNVSVKVRNLKQKKNI